MKKTITLFIITSIFAAFTAGCCCNKTCNKEKASCQTTEKSCCKKSCNEKCEKTKACSSKKKCDSEKK